MLHDGLYEQIINKGLETELSTTDQLSTTAPIDSAEASKVLAKYIAEVVEKGLDNVADNGGDVSSQVALANRIISTIIHLVKLFPDRQSKFKKYDPDSIRIFGLYIPFEKVNLSEDDSSLYENLIFVQPKTLNYFAWISQCIRHSARNEVFRFLNIKDKDIGLPTSSSESAKITAPIIYPRHFVGSRSQVTKSKV